MKYLIISTESVQKGSILGFELSTNFGIREQPMEFLNFNKKYKLGKLGT